MLALLLLLPVSIQPQTISPLPKPLEALTAVYQAEIKIEPLPDYTANYHKTIEEPREAAERAEVARQLLIAQQAAQAFVAPQIVPVSQSTNAVAEIIRKWSTYYGLDYNYMMSVAGCESGLRSNAVNNGYTAGGGHPTGVYQFLPETFASYSARAGFSGDIFNADDNVHAAAYAFSHGGSGNWACA